MVATFLLLAAVPWTAGAQTSEPWQNPASIKFGSAESPLGALGSMSALTINLGSFSGSGKGYMQAYMMITTTDHMTGLQPVNYEEKVDISGTYKNGVLEGKWTGETSIVDRPGNVEFGSIHTRSQCSGTFRSRETVTSRNGQAVFEGSCTDYWDDYEEASLVRSDRTEEVKVDVDAYFKFEGGEKGGGGPGVPGVSGGPDAPPGIGGISDLPGPDSLVEGIAGVLVPGIIGIIGGLLMGGGGTGLAEPPAAEQPPGPEKPEDDHEESEPADLATDHAKKILEMFEKRSPIDKNPKIKELVGKARETAFDENGMLKTGEWVKIKSDLRDAVREQAGEPGSTSTMSEVMDSMSIGAKDAMDTTAKGISDMADGIKNVLTKSLEGYEKVLNSPESFAIGLSERFKEWKDGQKAAEEKFGRDFGAAVDKGDLESALKSLVEYGSKTPTGSLVSTLTEMGKEMLPVEEIGTLLDSNASLEEKLWAVPAAATKLAGLLIGTEIGEARVPGAGGRSFIPSARSAAAAEEAAAAGAGKGAGAAVDDVAARAGGKTGGAAAEEGAAAGGKGGTAGADEAAAGKPKKPGPGDKAEASPEAKAREAQKSAERGAEREAETARGEAARARNEQRFNDPQQRAGYEAEYKDYMDKAQQKADAIVDTVSQGKAPSPEQLTEAFSDAAAMRKLKDASQEARKGIIEAQNKILEPTKSDVETFLSNQDKYRGQEIRVENVRTPGKDYDPATSINTDNDVHAIRKVTNPDGSTSWREIPSEEWKQAYHDSFAKNSGFDVETAKKRFDTVDWDNMTPEQQTRKWGELHQQEPGDVFDATSSRDFRKTSQDPLHAGPGSDDSAFAAAKRGEGKLTDAEQLGIMEKEKFAKEWNKGTIEHQAEALEQLRKQGEKAQDMIDGYKLQNAKVEDLPADVNKALDIVRDKSKSPLERADLIKKLGFKGGPTEISDILSGKISSLKIARPK